MRIGHNASDLASVIPSKRKKKLALRARELEKTVPLLCTARGGFEHVCTGNE